MNSFNLPSLFPPYLPFLHTLLPTTDLRIHYTKERSLEHDLYSQRLAAFDSEFEYKLMNNVGIPIITTKDDL